MARSMKDSGIEWIGKIPVDWKLHRMKSCVASRVIGAWGNEPAGDENDVICMRIADFDYSRFRFKDTPQEELTKRNYDSEIIEKLMLKSGDILLEKSGGGEKTPVGRSVIFDKNYPALYANFMERIRCSDFVSYRWMQYAFITFYKNEYSRNYIKQTTGIQNLDITSLLCNERLPVPSIEEQTRIADFLDEKCAGIDAVIEKTRASIEDYKKLKQSVITQAVTKGIRPNRPLKPSGIDWIGDIPEDWEIRKIKYVSIFQPTCDTSKLTEESVITYTPMECIKNGYFINNTARYANVAASLTPYENGDIVIAKVTPCFENGNISIMENLSSGYGLGSSELFVFRPQNIETKYLFYWLRNESFMQQGRSTMTGTGGLKRVSPAFMRNCPITFPGKKEQQEISDYLDEKTAEIDALIAQKERFISEMEAYKKSLIYEYVTGKRGLSLHGTVPNE